VQLAGHVHFPLAEVDNHLVDRQVVGFVDFQGVAQHAVGHLVVVAALELQVDDYSTLIAFGLYHQVGNPGFHLGEFDFQVADYRCWDVAEEVDEFLRPAGKQVFNYGIVLVTAFLLQANHRLI